MTHGGGETYPGVMTDKLWAHSGDSHFLEPADLWHQILPKAQADRMPRTERISDNEERVTVDGKSFTRRLPKILTAKGAHRRDHRRDVATGRPGPAT